MAAKSLEFKDQSDNKPVKLFFQDEARFGRIDNISSCWVPPGGRASVGKQIIREYLYAYLTVCPETGENYSLILPYANKNCMDIFMQGVSDTFSNYRIIMVMDGASWHSESNSEKCENILPMLLPAYSPELNPTENMWHHIREKGGFKNTTFHTMKDVELRLAETLKNLDKKTVISISGYKWIIEALC